MVIVGDALTELACMDAESVHCCVTSPPYWGLRDYGVGGQMGLEKTPEEYMSKLVEVFREVRRVLRDNGTLWLNLGDSYVGATSQHRGGGSQGHNSCISKKTMAGVPSNGRGDRNRALYSGGLAMKQLLGIPWRVAFALQADRWYLRSDIIWHKPNPMPESVTDRCTKAHEYIFLMSKSERYYFNADAIAEPAISGTDLGLLRGKNAGAGDADKVAWHAQSIADRQANGVDSRTGNPSGKRNRRDVWTIATQPFPGAHFAVMPEALVKPCILAGCPEGGTVLDPFAGAGTVGVVAAKNQREFVGIELNPEYAEMARSRIEDAGRQKCLFAV